MSARGRRAINFSSSASSSSSSSQSTNVALSLPVSIQSHAKQLRDPNMASHVLFAAFVHQLKIDFPNAHINALSHGTIDEDFTTFVTSHLFLGSLSTFSLWAGVACLGRAHIPQSQLFNSGYSRTLRIPPLLDFAPALVVESARAQRLLREGRGLELVEEIMRV